MAKSKRAEIWLADSQPVLVLGCDYQGAELPVVTFVPRRTQLHGTQYEVAHECQDLPHGAFDAQGIATLPEAKLERRLGNVSMEKMAEMDEAVRAWLGL